MVFEILSGLPFTDTCILNILLPTNKIQPFILKLPLRIKLIYGMTSIVRLLYINIKANLLSLEFT